MFSRNGNILIVDDNKNILSALEILLTPVFGELKSLTSPEQIPAELRKKDYNIVVLDMNFKAGINTGNEGIFWLGKIREINPDISVVMITAYGDIETAVKTLKAGATDFVLKPWRNDKLLQTKSSALEEQEKNRTKTDVLQNQ